MSPNSLNIPAALNRLVSDGALTERALQAMTQIEAVRLRAALSPEPAANLNSIGDLSLTDDETARLSVLTAQLTAGMTIEDDERLKAIIESLGAEVHLSTQNIADLIDVRVDDIDLAVNHAQSVPAETKYTIAIRCSYLMNAIDRARGR